MSVVERKSNPLMDMFALKRPAAEPLPIKRPLKKFKPSEDKLTDPLYQILSWREQYTQYLLPEAHTCRVVHTPNLLNNQWQQEVNKAQGLFINVDWAVITPDQFRSLLLPVELMDNGIVFIWGAKNNIGFLMDHFEQLGFTYAENFAFVHLSKQKIPAKGSKLLNGNRSILNFFQSSEVSSSKVEGEYEIGKVRDPAEIFTNNPSQYFRESQRVLYMFRRINKKEQLELRHQRTSDVYFTIGEGLKLDWKAKDVIYNMIETLLVNANYKNHQKLKLVELWGNQQQPREGWITVCQTRV